VFESEARLTADVASLLGALRERAAGRYAVLFDRRGVLQETPDAEAGGALRRLVESRADALLRVPAALHGSDEMADLFEAWGQEEFFLAVVNARVGVLVACEDAAELEQDAGLLLQTLADRLLRLHPAWRVDEKGRGLFMGRPRLDTVVIPRAG
jgi:hypothetical protein